MQCRITPDEIKIAAKTIWSNSVISKVIGEETVDTLLLAQKRKPSFFAGKTSRGLVGGLFYLLGYKYDSAKNQKELADRLCTSDVTIRASYRNWLKEFPDVFQDVVVKLAQDQNIRWYMLVDYRQKTYQLQL
jgi:endonuclease III-like uncharacterized protein